jgi:ABC-type molybdate transport system substrate-binding protein
MVSCGRFGFAMVATGEVDAAIAQSMEALLQPGAEMVGLLPAGLQSTKDFAFAAGVMAKAREPDAARSSTKYLIGPSVKSMLKSKGMGQGQGD